MEQEHQSNNHHSIVELQGAMAFVFTIDGWIPVINVRNRKRQRKICAEYLYFNDDGTIQPVARTTEGLSVPPKQ